MCACGKTVRTEAITANVAQQIIDEQRRQDEYEVMIASAGQAIGNADSGSTAQR